MKHYLKKQQLFVLHKVSTLLSTLHCVSSLYSTSYLTCPPRGSTSRATCSLGYEKEFNCNFLCIRSPPVTSPLILIFFNSANYSNIYAVPPTLQRRPTRTLCAHGTPGNRPLPITRGRYICEMQKYSSFAPILPYCNPEYDVTVVAWALAELYTGLTSTIHSSSRHCRVWCKRYYVYMVSLNKSFIEHSYIYCSSQIGLLLAIEFQRSAEIILVSLLFPRFQCSFLNV